MSKRRSSTGWLFYSITLVLMFLAGGCATVPETIMDIRDIKQDHISHIDKHISDRALISDDDQKRMDNNFNSRYFAPWRREKPCYQREIVERGFEKYKNNSGYGENGRKHSESWIKNLAANAQLDNYPNSGFPAITIENADLRVLPTQKPRFYDLSYSHHGYPFDTLQESSVAANTPLFISHMTRDKAWVLVETPYAVGWMSVRSVAFVDGSFMKTWERGRYAVIIKDKIPLYDGEGRFLFQAPLGAVFPKIEENAENIRLLSAVADKNGKAFIKTVVISRDAATVKPLRLTTSNIAKIANELINEPYGWGGLYQNRDCSAMIKDMFAPFGLWLPRHSADQANEVGAFISLRELSPEEKEAMILKQGIPYLTLLWRRGHIMLYIGNYQGKALIFHNLWGVRTKDFLGREGRRIVGHAAITTLNPGMEFRNDDTPESNYINSILGMTLLINPENSEHPHPALPHREEGKKEGGFSEERYKK